MGAQTITIGYHTNQVLPEPDIFIHTSGGTRIPAHSTILASVSPVWENIIDQPYKHRSSERVIQIHGVPCNAVTAFVTFHYSSMCGEKEMEEYGMHLLTLAHVYMVPQLKQKCIKGLTQRLTVENVVDLFQLARLCDAPDLRLNCMKLLTNHFKAVEKTEGWKFLNQNDPCLELQILRFMDEHQTRKEKSRRQRKEQGLYVELGEAMECLEHICTEGCTDVGPCHVEIRKEKMKPCTKFSTCQGLQLLIRHFATCKRRINGRCLRCKRMWQLFKLHSYICQQTDSCKVPLCRDQHGIFNFGVHEPRNMPNMCTSVIDPSLKAMTDDVYYIVWERKSIAKEIQFKMQQEKREDEPRWKVLAKKVASAKVISSLTLPKRKRD